MKNMLTVLLASLGAACCACPRDGEAWEYKFMLSDNLLALGRPSEASGGQVEDALCKLGADGWELVIVAEHELIFKRPLVTRKKIV